MSGYYKSQRNDKHCYKKGLQEPFKLSRSKIDNFIKCPHCFYLDRVLGTSQPPGYPFALNSAVDHLLKQEFDTHRAEGTQHPLIEKYGVDARPAAHKDLDMWRETFKGVQYLHVPTNLYVFGAIDDLWINSKGEYIVVDYKATSKNEEITALDKDWQDGYKRQMEVYQWLLRRNDYKVSNTGYFVYCNGDTDKKAFDGKLEFDITLIPYVGDDYWVEKTLFEIKKCLDSDVIPESGEDCDFCAYFYARKDHEL
jgi:CRISPR/Cas system-associated exonuclease Cas4 (RecB family)